MWTRDVFRFDRDPVWQRKIAIFKRFPWSILIRRRKKGFDKFMFKRASPGYGLVARKFHKFIKKIKNVSNNSCFINAISTVHSNTMYIVIYIIHFFSFHRWNFSNCALDTREQTVYVRSANSWTLIGYLYSKMTFQSVSYLKYFLFSCNSYAIDTSSTRVAETPPAYIQVHAIYIQ